MTTRRTREQVIADCFRTGKVQYEGDVAPSPKSDGLWLLESTLLHSLGPRPPWWRFFARRKWHRAREAVNSMDREQVIQLLLATWPEESADKCGLDLKDLRQSWLQRARRPRVSARSCELRYDALGNELPPAVIWTED